MSSCTGETSEVEVVDADAASPIMPQPHYRSK